MSRLAEPGSLPPRLDPNAIYRSPQGRLCVLRDVDYHEPLLRNGAAVAHFEYVGPDGRPAATNMADGFSLTRGNWARLQAVGRRQEAG